MTRRSVAILSFLLLSALISKAQLSENFSDGNFTNAPKWVTSNDTDWIINSALQLQSNKRVANSDLYISTASTLATTAQWELYVELAFNTSSTNYVDIYLTASQSDLTQTSFTGYFVRLGSSKDNISLYRKDGTTNTLLIAGVSKVLNHTDNKLKIKVIRDASNKWLLLRDTTGTGNNYFDEGTATDATYTTAAFFGIFVKQSTAKFFAHHYFNDIVVKPYAPDVTPPVVRSVTVTSANTLNVLFDEPLDSNSSQNINNYLVNGLGIPVSASQDIANSALVHVFFTVSFNNGTNNQLVVNNVKDISGNAIKNDTTVFGYFAPHVPQQYDVVIDEIMSDPTPQVGLPDDEWIELKNTSASPINLKGWTISDLTDTSGAMPDLILLPDSFVIVCSSSAFTAMSAFGKTVAVTNFPSLDNAGDQLVLNSDKGKTIHAVNYSLDEYQNELKKNGGWSLEMIDTKNPCSGFSNWIASVDPSGGTPGRKNSIDTNNIDETPPHLLRAYAVDDTDIMLVFNEPLDSINATDINNYMINDGIGEPKNVIAMPPMFDKVNLKLTSSLTQNKIYTVTANSLTDCVGNKISSNNTASVGLSSLADSFDVVINEILFNPKPNGVDYVEIYNRSNKAIDLKQLYIANRNGTGIISSITPLTTDDNLLFPQGFIVITTSPNIVRSQYITLNPDAFVTVNSMPSFNDDNGDVILLNAQGNIVDELQYDASWQFPLITNVEGVSLERINYDAPTQSTNNWHSAATSVGYGTPTYKNSQYRIDQQLQGEINVSPPIFSPDNDGIDDFATISYSFPEPGYIANITVFDASGRPVRYLQQNVLCGTKGNYYWDGLGDKKQQLPIGIYIVFTEVFNLNGTTKQFKNTVVLARRN